MSRIVCIGGGTGLHILLRGLKERFPSDELNAVVTMMDSGGSTGRLRDEFGYLPPGDVRQSLVALSDAPQELRQLMQHRFHAPGSSLDGHVIGNLLLTALKDLNGGDEYAAIESMERLLRIRGKVYPVTMTDCHLVAEYEDGTRVEGETNIDVPKHDAKRITQLSLQPQARLFGPTGQVIRSADYIIVGPGDLYTSLMPNLLVQGMTDALRYAKRNGARIIYVTNTMTKHGETTGFRASDFVHVVQNALDGATIDAVVVNTGAISEELRVAYAKERAEPVVNDLGCGHLYVVCEDLVSRRDFARHSSDRLAQAIEHAMLSLRTYGGEAHGAGTLAL